MLCAFRLGFSRIGQTAHNPFFLSWRSGEHVALLQLQRAYPTYPCWKKPRLLAPPYSAHVSNQIVAITCCILF